MKTFVLAAVLVRAFFGQAFAWGPEGHSIAAEIAQERLTKPAAENIHTLLHGCSLASIAS